ncbi:hypothetical protein JCM10207_004682 [Rhodosporidiobolus poonsookiae]
MQPSQDYYRPHPPPQQQPMRPPAPYSSYPAGVRPLPSPGAPSRPAQPSSSLAQSYRPSMSPPPPQGAGGYRPPSSYGSPAFGGEFDQATWSGQDSLRRSGGPSSSAGPQGGYEAHGAYRREPSSGSGIMSPGSQGRNHTPLPPVPPRQPSYPLTPSITPHPPSSTRFPTSPPSSHSPTQRPSYATTSSPHLSPLPHGTICTATSDLESLAVIPLGGLGSIEAVKDLIMTKLHIADEDMPRHAFYLTQIGRGEGRPVPDDELWDAVRTGAGQVTVFVKEVVPASQGGGTFSAADFAAGMSAERMRQVNQARERDRAREARERQRSAGGSSGGGGGGGNGGGAGADEARRRGREASISSRSDVSSGHRERARGGEVDEFGSPSLRSDRPAWAMQGSMSGGGSGYAGRGLSSSEGASQHQQGAPHPRTASGGQLSPPTERYGSGFRDRQGSLTPTTLPEDYFTSSPPLASTVMTSPSIHSTPSAVTSPYHPHLPTPPPHVGGSSQIVMGPSGPTRRLPPQPHERMHTAPSIQVTSPGWTHSVAAPAPPPSAPTYPFAPSSRPVVSPPLPPPTAPAQYSRPPTDPRNALPQYSSQPYKNLPMPSSSTPYHNLSLQNQLYSVVHPSPQPGGSSLRPPPQPPKMLSKSADNLRSHYGATVTTPQPPQPPAMQGQYRPPTAPSGHPGAAGSRPLQPPVVPPLPSSYVSTPPVVPTPASAFYSAPVQAQHQAAALAASYPSPPQPGQLSQPPKLPVPHPPVRTQTHDAIPSSATATGKAHPRFASENAYGAGGIAPMRPSTMYDLTTGALDLRPGETVQMGKTRRASENGPAAGADEVREREGDKARSASDGAAGLGLSSALPASLQAGNGARAAPDAALTTSPPTLARSPPTPASALASPPPSDPPFQDDDGAYDGIADADRRPLPSAGASASPPSSVRSSGGPLTPATDAPVAPAGLPKLDEYGDPLDEETSTWFKPPPPSGPRVDEYGDPIDEETSTWFKPPAASGPRVDEYGDPIDEETSTWFKPPPPSEPKPPAPTPLQTSGHTQSQPPPPTSATTTAVPAPSSYGSSSPMRRQHSAPGSNTGSTILNVGPGSAGSGHDRKDSIPTAQDWTQTILSRFGASNVTTGEEGTLVPAGGAGTGTLRPVEPSAPPARLKLVDEYGDDLEDEGATFFPGHGPAHALNSPSAAPSSPLSSSFDRHKRPNLRLTIDAPTPPASAQASAASAANTGHASTPPVKPDSSAAPPLAGRRTASGGEHYELSPLPNIGARRSEGRRGNYGTPRLDDLVRLGNGPTPGPAGAATLAAGGRGSPFARRNSFAARAQDDKDWAFRPPVETVLEHLDVFFPEHDLDKPVFDLPTPGPSTPSTNSSSSPVRDVAAPVSASSSTFAGRRQLPGASGLGYKKSIRVVALDRKRQLQKAGRNVASAASGLASNLLRRKSTKLFGARIEEVTSAQMSRINAIKETSDEDPENFSYKWIKGDLIGRGTYGHVYIALSVTTGETIAVKQVEMPRTYSDKEDQRTKGMISSLKAEIELLKDLDHPNIVLYLGMEQTPEFLSIFLEYVPGGSIGRIIRTHGKFEENVIKFFTLQILDGLEYLHSLGILHRDMKADNILIDQDGMCKISDFGTSKKSGDIYQNNEAMSMQGSIFWMAPEVVHNGNQGYSAKADLWSLGCIVIEMTVGARPWGDEPMMSALFKLGAERQRPPLPPDVEVSANADRFISACLAIEPEDRPKAAEAKLHPFLVIDPGWNFTETSLYGIMTHEEERRRVPGTPSAPPA